MNQNLENKEDIYMEFHPCKYCGNSCKGKQCKQCHLKMISRNHDCIDCDIKFTSLRCFSCQDFHNKNNLSTCPDCSNLFLSFTKDGKCFQKCYECYQNGFANCKKCNKRCFKQYSFCKECYFTTKIDEVVLETNCKSKDCTNKTAYIFCQECYKNFNFVKQ